MSLKPLKLPILRVVGLSFGIALLLGSTGAMAAPQSPSDEPPNSPTDTSTPSPVIVQPETGPINPSTIPSTPPTSSGGSSLPAAESQARFSCEFLNGQYTVMYHPQSQPNQSYPWAIPAALGNGWNSARRCDAISQRLESYRPDGLIELRTAVENNYNTICVTTERDPSCRIVLTVPPGQDPVSTRDRVFQNLTIADNGQQTEGVNTLTGGKPTGEVGNLYNLGQTILGGGRNSKVASNSINLRPFLDRADGGTGTQLQGGVQERTNTRLNPNNFR